MTRSPTTVAAGLGLVLVMALQVAAIHRQSLSGDGAYHLIAGHQALRYGQNQLNLEHPPLAKLVMATPLLLEPEPLLPPIRVDQALAAVDTLHEDGARMRRATIQGRYANLLVFVIPLLAVCFAWARQRTGSASVGVMLVLMLGLSFNVVPNLALLQTDAAVSLGVMLVLWLVGRPGWERMRSPSALLLGVACGLAAAAKFSGVLALAPAGVALAVAHGHHRLWRRSLLACVWVGLGWLAVIEVTYAVANTRYDAAAGRETITRYARNQGTLVVDNELAAYEASLLRLEAIDPRLAQWLTGLLGVRAQNAIGVYPSYAFGVVQSSGRWWYFPVLLLVKTPLVLLGAFAVLLALCCGVGRKPWRVSGVRAVGPWRPWLPALVFVAVYLATAVTSNYNLGFRHLLPVLPILYLPLAWLLAERRRWGLVVVGVLALESGMLTPLWMSATNTWWLGAHNPTRFVFSHGNLTYRQNFLTLAQATRAKGIHDLKVIYPPLGNAIIQAYLDDARMVEPGAPLEPGWYAVSAFVEQMVPALLSATPGTVYGQEGLVTLARAWLPTWQTVARGEDHGYVAGTFHLYRLDTPTLVAP